jgi:hypothetical protein
VPGADQRGAHRRGGSPAQRLNRVGRRPGEQRRRFFGVERRGNRRGGSGGRQAEVGQFRNRGSRSSELDGGAQQHGSQPVKTLGRSPESFGPLAAVDTELRHRAVDRAVHGGTAAAVERMGAGHLGLGPVQTVSVERQGPKVGGGSAEGVGGGAHIVEHAGQGQLLCSGATADLFGRFDDADVETPAGEPHGGRQAVGARPDDDGIALGGHADPEHVSVLSPIMVRG